MQRTVWLKAITILTALTAVACAKSRSSHPASTPNSTPPPMIDPNGASAYGGSTLDPQTALNGMGQWVTIGDEQYFVPDQTQLQDDDGDDWAPYQRGYWNYDDEKSWTWVSYEPFGWMTDHYGVWRHHAQHGWIWLPFNDRHYEPCAVTWFDEGNYVGWYPYFADYSRGYRHGASFGFDDGYWDTFNIVVKWGSPGFNFYMGFTLVERGQFSQPNIRLVRSRNMALVWSTAARAHAPDRIRLGRVGRYPGGRRDGAFDFLQRYSQRRAPMGRAERVRSRGGAEIIQPHRTHQVPDNYRRRFEQVRPQPQTRPAPRNDRRDNDRDRDRGRHDNGRVVPTPTPSPSPSPSPGRFHRPDAEPARPMRPQVVPPATPQAEPRHEEPRRDRDNTRQDDRRNERGDRKDKDDDSRVPRRRR